MNRSLTLLVQFSLLGVIIPIIVSLARQFHREGMARVRAGEGRGE
jgi:hypothetical protein